MSNSIICSGALFYATSTKRFLFLQRTDSKTKGAKENMFDRRPHLGLPNWFCRK